MLRAELIEARNLLEHWDKNMPLFNVSPRVEEPERRSGRDFAKRNPGRRPYGQHEWSNKTGARLLPNVTAPALHRLLDDVEAEILASDPELGRFVPPRAPSPWLHEDGEWWPKADGGLTAPQQDSEEAIRARLETRGAADAQRQRGQCPRLVPRG
jgi:hypothetical protein